MLAFLAQLFSYAGKLLKCPPLEVLGHKFPKTLYRARKWLGVQSDKFTKYASCTKCHAIYTIHSATESGSRNVKTSKRCSYVRYNNHPMSRMRSACGNLLMKTMRSSKGSSFLLPFSTYCYHNPILCLQELLNRPCIVDLCEQWRNRIVENNILCDIFDGQMWQHFQYDCDGKPFLAEPMNYLLLLNCDWFQPFKHTQYSVGVLYVALGNLPRQIRFRRENILVLGIIPGPTEPSKNINSYLDPLVSDLKLLWTGVNIKINGKPTTIRAAISCLACDVPAARKVGGFVGHNANKGCNKCLKEFPVETFGENPDYSGFKKSEWEPRCHGIHVWYANQQKCAKTEKERKGLESMHGARYTSLYALPYYNAISSCIIDPMHCLFLGIAKHCFKVWLLVGVLQDDCLSDVQAKVDSFKCPAGIGRIPYKIASKVSGLKADQWKNWTMYFSLYALKSVLPYRDYDCWLCFVKICTKICQRKIETDQLHVIDNMIEDFCTKFQQLYGKKHLTPNMHLLAHITDCIRDHGPVYAFWLYAFERLNGVLGSFSTSQHDVSVQIMRKLNSMQSCHSDCGSQDFASNFGQLFAPYVKETGSLLETMQTSIIPTAIPPILEKAFDDTIVSSLQSKLFSLYPDAKCVEILRLHKSTRAISLDESIKLASSKSNFSHCSKVIINTKLIEISSFVQCKAKITDAFGVCCDESFWFLSGSSYLNHSCKLWFGYPTEVWTTVLNDDMTYYFINEISSRVIFVETLYDFGRIIGEDKVLIVTPVPILCQ